MEKGEREVGGELTLSPAKLHADGGDSQGKKRNGKGEREGRGQALGRKRRGGSLGKSYKS